MIEFDIESFKSWVIKKGKHYCSKLFRFSPYLRKERFSQNVIFTTSCKYHLDYPDNLDINKLFGLSYGYHHRNSARFGWHYNAGNIQLFAYCYINGKRKESFICSLKIGTQYKLTLITTSKKYCFVVTSKETLRQVQVPHPRIPNYGYRLNPYFGGNQVAPQEMEILIHENED